MYIEIWVFALIIVLAIPTTLIILIAIANGIYEGIRTVYYKVKEKHNDK